MGCHLFASFLAFSTSFAIMPLELDDRQHVSSGLTGIILSVLYIPTFILGLCLNRLAHECGRKCLYLSGLYIFTVGTLLFGMLEFVSNGPAFVAVAISMRLMVGFGTFFAKTILPSIMSKRFPNDMDAMFTYMGTWITIALGVGPALGQQIYSITNHNFFIPHLIAVVVVALVFIPSAHFMLREKSLTRTQSSMMKTESIPRTDSPDLPRACTSPGAGANSSEAVVKPLGGRRMKRLRTTVDEKKFSICEIFKSIRAITLSLVIFWNIFYLLFWQSILGLELEEVYGKGPDFIAFAYLLRSIIAVPISLSVPWISNRLGRILCIFLTSLVHFFAFLFLGPSKVFGLPGNPNLILLGLAMKGIADPFMFNLCIP